MQNGFLARKNRRGVNPYRRKEWPTYGRYLVRRGLVLPAALHVLKSLAPDRRRAPESAPSQIGPWRARPCFGAFPPLSPGPDASALTVPLATREISLQEISWNASFEDQEDVFALHRFGWLLPALLQRPSLARARLFWRQVLDWMRVVRPRTHPLAWETYTVAERLVYWPLLFSWLKASGSDVPEEEEFLRRLWDQARYVAGHLEFFGQGPDSRTNNHLINDGRGLYVAGSFLQSAPFQAQGRALILRGMAESFTSRGFLREGSSHYHLLLLSRYAEVRHVAAHAGDESFVAALDPFLDKLRNAALFFQPDPPGPFPLLGDISPDFPPAWLESAAKPAGRSAPAWRDFWGGPESSAQETLGFDDRLPDGWCRYDAKRYKVFWHVEPLGSIPVYSHAQHDTGAFELQVDRRPFLMDTGRASYRPDAAGHYGRSARAHNSCLVDGHEPFVSPWLNGGRWLLPSYQKTRVRAEARGNSFFVEHEGFSRLPGAGLWRRVFRLGENEVEVEDFWQGAGAHDLDIFFHFSPDVETALERNVCRFTRLRGRGVELTWESAPGLAAALFRGQSTEDGYPIGWYSPRYGKSLPTTTLRFQGRVEFPFKARFTWKFL